jgi:rubrerythrin
MANPAERSPSHDRASHLDVIPNPQTRQKLIDLLQMAYSGEKSAALAYQGHAANVKCPDEKAGILKIEADEWHHRDWVGVMLTQLASAPMPAREILQVMIGRVLKVLCPVSGWFLPMYCAWKLEENNIEEYAKAAALATACNESAMAAELLRMAEVEREHAAYFAALVEGKYPDWPGLAMFLAWLDKLILLGKSR